jgi:hypothetical protein
LVFADLASFVWHIRLLVRLGHHERFVTTGDE